jgi:hypothetical protein
LAVVLGTSRASKVYYLGRGWFPNLLRLLMWVLILKRRNLKIWLTIGSRWTGITM